MQEVFWIFQDKKIYFESVSAGKRQNGIVFRQILVIFIFSFIYGVVMGSYNGALQALFFAFVGMQLAWSLRPFLGDKYQEFELFRAREGNFYLAVIQSGLDMFGVRTNTPEPKAETAVPSEEQTPEKLESPEANSTTTEPSVHGKSE